MSASSSFLSRLKANISLLRRAYAQRGYVDGALRDSAYVERAWAERHLISQVFGQKDLVIETLRLASFVSQALDERFWLEGTLERKDFVMRALDEKRADETALVSFEASLAEFQQKAVAAGARLTVRAEDIYPQLHDAMSSTNFDRHYLYHPAWAARVLARTRPDNHVDISSILHFSTLLSAFIPTRFYDYRPAVLDLSGLSSNAADLLALPFEDGSLNSLSCMHVLEHIGLGRYGEPLDPDGDLKAIAELVRVLEPGGNLLVATPVGQPRVQFNAHRVYDHEAFAAYFAPLVLLEFALIPESGDSGYVINPAPARVRAETYGCGCFWLRKPAS